MNMYEIGRLALPVVVGLIGIASFLMVITMVFTVIRIISMVQRLSQSGDHASRSPVTIHIHTDKPFPSHSVHGVYAPNDKPPMRAKRLN